MKLAFSNVGRDKRSFEVVVRGLDDPRIERALRQKGGLMSRDVDLVCAPDEQGNGFVVVGGFRPAGEWRRVEE